MNEGPRADFLAANAPRRLTSLRGKLQPLLQGVYRFRPAAAHIFVFMISSEQRDTKRYAVPVQCVPYASLKDSECRQLTNAIIGEMKKRGMKVAGICNYIQCQVHFVDILSCTCCMHVYRLN